MILAALLVAALLALAWYFRPRARAGRRLARLRERYLRRAGMPRALALESLERQTARLREQIPGRSAAWYVARALSDLDRDRR